MAACECCPGTRLSNTLRKADSLVAAEVLAVAVRKLCENVRVVVGFRVTECIPIIAKRQLLQHFGRCIK